MALNGAGCRTSGNRGANPFSKHTVRVLLRIRFYVGELPDGNGGWAPGKHVALIAPALIEAAQRARVANASRPRWTERVRTPWALSGVAVCVGCGANVNALSHAMPCAGQTQGNGRAERSCYTELIEDQVGELLGRLERLREAYLDAELDRAEYHAREAAAEREPAVLPPERDPGVEEGQLLAAFRKDVAAWAANPWGRNELARRLVAQVAVLVSIKGASRTHQFAVPPARQLNDYAQ